MDRFINENIGNETFCIRYSSEQSSLNVLCNDDTHGFSASDDNVLHTPNATTSMASFAIDGHVGYPSNNNNEQVLIQNLSVNSPNMAFNSPQIPANNSDIFRFMIPGFQIIVIPMPSSLANLNNLDMRYQFQQDPSFLNPPLHSSSISQSQLNQEQSYISSVNGTTSGGINNQSVDNDNLQHYHQQQNYNYSFSNFNNLHG